MNNEITVDIPLRITVSVGGQALTRVVGSSVESREIKKGLERVDIDPDYGNRKGYDASFLGIDVPLPTLNPEQRRNAAKNSMVDAGQDNTVLHYHHFSLVMNRRRQLAYYTAVNINGARSRKPERAGDQWYYDPRIAETEQIGEDLYARNKLDRGHLVRRLDPAWGSISEALNANNDTFHFTNCSPQHAGFNQSSETWQGIENYLLNSAQQDRKALTIFTGPVLTDEDPLYRGVRLPLHFWKIALFAKNDGTLSVTAYLLSQEDLVGDVSGLERFDPEVFQVTVDEIIARTGLDFSYLLDAQIELAQERGIERSPEDLPRKKLAHTGEIKV
ncbi:MAG TPA: DNA/RNA non-specific endonuclease [Cellvibrio sp.]|nr:DNA/RNA non-specific endonuclease [Cellvibrio sp.]